VVVGEGKGGTANMKYFPWEGRVAVVALLFAFAFNLVHYAVFRDSSYIAMFIIAQLGFLPISVYLVTVVINQLLGRREKQAMLKKLNMVIGSFFSEVGTDLLRLISRGKSDKRMVQKHLLVSSDWSGSDYSQAHAVLKEVDIKLSHAHIDWENLRSFLMAKKYFLLHLLGNPNLLEHETFTDLLWAVFHLAEELANRKNVSLLPESDYEHLIGDIKRVNVLLMSEWLDYMNHLQEDYPFLFSLAVRTNPFNPDAKTEVM
jgi:hypothetical protein